MAGAKGSDRYYFNVKLPSRFMRESGGIRGIGTAKSLLRQRISNTVKVLKDQRSVRSELSHDGAMFLLEEV
jgi:hypothetical protein